MSKSKSWGTKGRSAAAMIFGVQLLCLFTTSFIALGTHSVAMAQEQKVLVDPVDANARTALTKAQYQRVLDLYAPWIEADHLPALARYRIAISAANLGDFRLASRNIEMAKVLDPLGRYATSAERIDTLSQVIATGCTKTQACDIHASDSPDPIEGLETSPTEAASQIPVPPADAPEATALDAPVVTKPNAQPVEAVQIVAEKLSDTTASPITNFKAALANTNLGIGLLIFVCLFGIAVASYKRTHKRNPGSSSSDSFANELSELRDRMGTVLAKAQDAYPKSELVQQLVLALPVVERECGRCEYARNGDLAKLTPGDRAMLERVSALKAKPVNVLDCDRVEVAQMFQRQSWQ